MIVLIHVIHDKMAKCFASQAFSSGFDIMQ